MKRSRTFLAVAILFSIGLCCVVYRSVRTSAEAAGARRSAGEAAAAGSAELGELRQELFELRHQVLSHEQKLRVGDPAAFAPTQTEPPSPEARAEDERRYREFVAGIEAKFRDELRDPQWSAATAAAVQTALASDSDLRPLARGVECRSQTCRVEIADDGSGKLGKLLPLFAQQVGQSLPSMTADRVEDASGAATMVLYMSRSIEPAPAP